MSLKNRKLFTPSMYIYLSNSLTLF